MGKIAFIDFETDGHNRKGARLANGPSGADAFCYPVSVCVIVTDFEGNVLKESHHEIIPIDAYGKKLTISQEAIDIHGITTEHAMEFGVERKPIMAAIMKRLSDVDIAVAHNGMIFDFQILVAELIRHKLLPNTVLSLAGAEFLPTLFDTMKDPRIKKWVDARKSNGHKKPPSMGDVYRKCFGKDFANAHTALGDTTALKDMFFKMIELGIIDIPPVVVKE